MKEEAQTALVTEARRASNLSKQDWDAGMREARDRAETNNSEEVRWVDCVRRSFYYSWSWSQELVSHLIFETRLVDCLERAKVADY